MITHAIDSYQILSQTKQGTAKVTNLQKIAKNLNCVIWINKMCKYEVESGV